MFKVLLSVVTLVFLVTTFKFAYLASISMRDPPVLMAAGNRPLTSDSPQQPIGAPSATSSTTTSTTSTTTTTQEPGIASKNRTTVTPVTTGQGPATARPPPVVNSSQPPPITTTTFDPDADPDDVSPPGNDGPAASTPNATLNPVTPPPPPSHNSPDKTNPTDQNKPQLTRPGGGGAFSSAAETSVLFYSIFIVYVSFVKLAYHNVHFIKYNLTEQGILMIFGIIWQLVARQISTDYNSFPRFNSRIFFYLFLPSTVLESASMLSNKWLFFNLLPILTHSIIGTVLYASSMGITMFVLSRSDIFSTSNWTGQLTQTRSRPGLSPLVAPTNSGGLTYAQLEIAQAIGTSTQPLSTSMQLDVYQNDFSNLTLADCLVVGTILSSIDSAPMLNIFKQYQVNEKLYYLVLGENLLNQAVVITIFNLLIEFFETTRLTVMKCYITILQFFANLIGAVIIGLILALFALISVRLIKRFQVPHAISSYHNQCQAMVETLLILKLAYLTYTLSNLAGTSSILGLVTFGILNDQYIKHNLNLRSQLAFKQVILGMRTLGFSLVYPLLGMLLVDTAMSHSQLTSDEVSMATLLLQAGPSKQSDFIFDHSSHATQSLLSLTAPQRAPPSSSSSSQTPPPSNLNWNLKFLSIVILLTIVYRFLIVIVLGVMGNMLTCGQLKIKFKEQVLMAYGGFKGPLSIALVHSLIEHEDHKERIARNKHLFKYTILINIFISAVLAGTFIRPLVARIQSTLIGRTSTSLGDSTSSTIVFEQINYKLTEYVSHGLNSILGHTRSPYDKFIEFNETHIKPWLVRGDSNTNWLSIFYDNLILDETLNANCFYIVTEDPTTMRVLKLKLEDDKSKLTSWLRRRTSSVSILNTISEDSETTRQLAAKHVSLVPSTSTTSRQLLLSKGPIPHGSMTVPKDSEVLKEFVMFNLKLENARKRRRQVRKSSNLEGEKNNQYKQKTQATPAARHFVIDDSSTMSSDPPEESSLDRANRLVNLNKMEANLRASNANGNHEAPDYAPGTSRVHQVKRARKQPFVAGQRHQSSGGGPVNSSIEPTRPKRARNRREAKRWPKKDVNHHLSPI